MLIQIKLQRIERIGPGLTCVNVRATQNAEPCVQHFRQAFHMSHQARLFSLFASASFEWGLRMKPLDRHPAS